MPWNDFEKNSDTLIDKLRYPQQASVNNHSQENVMGSRTLNAEKDDLARTIFVEDLPVPSGLRMHNR